MGFRIFIHTRLIFAVLHEQYFGLVRADLWKVSDKLRQVPFHRITESQNSRGWKGPLWVI